jgi:hypothetical protein
MHAQPSQPGHQVGSLLAAEPQPAPADEPDRTQEQRVPELRERLEAIRLSARGASSWLESSGHYARLINRGGFVPVSARFDVRDLAFLGSAREQVLGFARLGLRIIDLHQPLDAGGITSNPASPVQRCRSCMWRWPCPTFRVVAEVLDELPPPPGGRS